MKILRFNDDRIGILKGGNVIDVSELILQREARGPQSSMEDLIGNFDAYKPRIEALAAQGSGTPLSGVRLRSPLARPGRVMAAFANYLDNPSRTKDSVVTRSKLALAGCQAM